MVIWKTYRSLLAGVVSGDLNAQDVKLFLVMALPWAVLQFFVLERCRRRFLQALPLLVLLAGVLIGEIMTVSARGWDGLGWGILTNYLSYGLLGDLCGAVVWLVKRRQKPGR